MSGSGNKYIADSVIDYLTNNPKPDAVVVSWSGLTRLDKPVNDSSQFQNYTWKKKLGNQTYVLSGGMLGSWREGPITKMLFENDYKFYNNEQLGYLSLLEMLKLQCFLKLNKIHYYFTSYVNYWDTTTKRIPRSQDFHLGQFASLNNLINQIDFDRFLFVHDHQPKTVFDVAMETDSFHHDGFHPGHEANVVFGEMVNWQLQKDLIGNKNDYSI